MRYHNTQMFNISAGLVAKKGRALIIVMASIGPVIRKHLPNLNLENLRQQRSTAMGYYGKLNRDAVGVWKIGDKHVEDLQAADNDTEFGTANLLSKDEFKDDYKQYYGLQSDDDYAQHVDSF